MMYCGGQKKTETEHHYSIVNMSDIGWTDLIYPKEKKDIKKALDKLSK